MVNTPQHPEAIGQVLDGSFFADAPTQDEDRRLHNAGVLVRTLDSAFRAITTKELARVLRGGWPGAQYDHARAVAGGFLGRISPEEAFQFLRYGANLSEEQVITVLAEEFSYPDVAAALLSPEGLGLPVPHVAKLLVASLELEAEELVETLHASGEVESIDVVVRAMLSDKGLHLPLTEVVWALLSEDGGWMSEYTAAQVLLRSGLTLSPADIALALHRPEGGQLPIDCVTDVLVSSRGLGLSAAEAIAALVSPEGLRLSPDAAKDAVEEALQN